MVYVFNELSLISKVSSLGDTCKLLEEFVRSCIRVKDLGFEELRFHEDHLPSLYHIPLHDDYTIGSWLEDKRVDEDLKNRFKEIITSFPVIRDNEISQHEVYVNSEFFAHLEEKEHRVWGLGVAALLDTLSISLATHEEWETTNVEIEHYYLEKDFSEETQAITVRHFSRYQHLDAHLSWWQQCQEKSLEKSAELWKRRKEFFPNLEFCDEVEIQLRNLGVSKTLLQIIDRLRALDNYVANWTKGSFNYTEANQNTNLRISPESESTLRKFGVLRKFSIPEQGKKTFDLHIKTGDLRFHFYPDENLRKVYIGYIGKHLRISSQN